MCRGVGTRSSRRLDCAGGFQNAHGFAIPAQHRHGERRAALVVGRLEIGAKLDEERQHGVVRLPGEKPDAVGRGKGGVQRRLAALEPRAAAQEAVRIFCDQPPDEIPIAERHGREDVVAGSALEEQLDHGLIALAHRPADDVAVVHVACALCVRAGVEKDAHALELGIRGRQVQRAGVVAEIAHVGIGAMGDEEPQCVGMAKREVQSMTAGGEALAREPGIILQELAQRRDVSGPARLHKCRDSGLAPAVEFGLQRPPAREAVLPGNRPLGIGELRRGLRHPQQHQPFLREFLEVVVRRAFGEIEGHRHLPSMRARCPQRRAGSQGL